MRWHRLCEVENEYTFHVSIRLFESARLAHSSAWNPSLTEISLAKLSLTALFKHWFRPQHLCRLSDCFCSAGAWDPGQVQSLLAALVEIKKRTGREPVYLDIGANIGSIALALAAAGFKTYAFEAMHRNQLALYSSLCATPELMDRLTIFPYGLGSAPAHCDMMSDSINIADGHTVCSEEVKAHMAAKGYTVLSSVDIVTLADFLEGVQIDVVKMDVEGFEPHVLAGSGAVLQLCSLQLALAADHEAVLQYVAQTCACRQHCCDCLPRFQASSSIWIAFHVRSNHYFCSTLCAQI